MANGNGDKKITVSEERLNSALATLELRIVRELHTNDEKSKTRHDLLKKDMEGIPEMVRNHHKDIESLKARDWWSTGIGSIIAIGISWFMGQGK